MKIDDADRAWGKAIPDYIENEDEKLPPVGRFNFGQKLFFWGIFYSVILLLLSGVVLWYTEDAPMESSVRALRRVLVHASVALITIGLFLIHVYMSAVLEEGSFGSMINGYVTEHGPGHFIAHGTTTSPANPDPSHPRNNDRCEVGSPHSPRQRTHFVLSILRGRTSLLRACRDISEKPLRGNSESSRRIRRRFPLIVPCETN